MRTEKHAILPEIANFEFMLPNSIIILDRDLIDKY